MVGARLLFTAMLVAEASCGDNLATPIDGAPPQVVDAPIGAPPPAVVILIGDGMGPAQVEVAARFRHGEAAGLAMQGLPLKGWVRTASPTGITDSAAAATALATGVFTWNGVVGQDREGRRVPTLLEDARDRGWATGLVTTTEITHATPAAFSAHVDSRGQAVDIANAQARDSQPDVLLGGGAAAYLPAGEGSWRNDAGLFDELSGRGFVVITTASELAIAASPDVTRLIGLFATSHLAYVRDRPAATTEPTLAAMTTAALTVLDRDPDGLFLMVEGGRIDHAGHGNRLDDVIAETLAFDDAIAAVRAWADARGNVTVIVTADHETGGLEVVTPMPAGTPSVVRWRWGNHSNARVPLYAQGPHTERFDGALVDARDVYQVARAQLLGTAVVAPTPESVPDGELADLRVVAVEVAPAERILDDVGVLAGLRVDADAYSLTIGVAGRFAWTASAVSVLVDVDPGQGTGVVDVRRELADRLGVADRALDDLAVRVSVPGIGFELAAISVGGTDPKYGEALDRGGLRGVARPYGKPDALAWLPNVINFANTRYRVPDALASTIAVEQGLEVELFWRELWPDAAGAPGRVPPGASIAFAVTLSSADGRDLVAVLPAAAVTALVGAPPGRTPRIDHVVWVELDVDGDGQVDAVPRVRIER